MRKFYVLGLFVMAATLSFGQYDLSVSMDNHSNNDNVSDDPLNMDFTIRNLGADLTDQDTIYFGITIGSNYYTVDNFTPGTVNGVTITGGLTSGSNFPVDVSDLTGSFLMTELGGSSGTVCVTVLGVGDSVLSSPTAGDTNPLNNLECVNWSDASDFGEYDVSQITVYPNPASEDVFFNLGTVQADQIQIMDITGRVINTINVTSSIEMLDVRDYQSGVYFYSVIKEGNLLTTEKFIVK